MDELEFTQPQPPPKDLEHTGIEYLVTKDEKDMVTISTKGSEGNKGILKATKTGRRYITRLLHEYIPKGGDRELRLHTVILDPDDPRKSVVQVTSLLGTEYGGARRYELLDPSVPIPEKILVKMENVNLTNIPQENDLGNLKTKWDVALTTLPLLEDYHQKKAQKALKHFGMGTLLDALSDTRVTRTKKPASWLKSPLNKGGSN